MKRMSFSETIFLFFLALIIFGPKKLPEIARYVGKTLAEFRRASNEFKAQIEQEIANLEFENRKQTVLPPSPPPEGATSRTLSAAPSEVSPAPSTSVETSPAIAPATATASEDEPLFAREPGEPTSGSNGGSGAVPASDAVATASSQESHV